jgi:LacI family transcriptional regulator
MPRARNGRQAAQSLASVTIIDVARAAGVSYATVSRVLNNKAHVKADKREAVLRAMTQLGYVANPQARSLAGGHSGVVGLLVHTLGSAYVGEIARGIDEELGSAQYDLILYTTHRHKLRESSYAETIARGMADGLLLITPTNAEAYLHSLHQRGYPAVLIDHQGLGEGGALVGATNRQGAYDATRYLIELGHRRIGFITGRLDVGCSHDRLAGHRQALIDSGLPADPALVFEGDFTQPAGFSRAQALLALPGRPTAIFASNDEMAFGVMEAVRDGGLRIPDDISVVGFDDIPQAAVVNPPLTSVRQPLIEMGRSATRMLLQLIGNPALAPEPVILPTRLIVRASTQRLS